MKVLIKTPGAEDMLLEVAQIRALKGSEWDLYSAANDTTYDNIVSLTTTARHRYILYTDTKTAQIITELYTNDKCIICGKVKGTEYEYSSENPRVS
jgi:hypothetical protein